MNFNPLNKQNKMNSRSELKKIRNYFGEHDKTGFEHWAYSFLDSFIKAIDEESATPLTKPVTDDEIEKLSFERYPVNMGNNSHNGDIDYNLFSRNKFFNDTTWMRDKAITRTALPREGEEIEVYSRDECVFEYCSAPGICRDKEKCQHH